MGKLATAAMQNVATGPNKYKVGSSARLLCKCYGERVWEEGKCCGEGVRTEKCCACMERVWEHGKGQKTEWILCWADIIQYNFHSWRPSRFPSIVLFLDCLSKICMIPFLNKWPSGKYVKRVLTFEKWPIVAELKFKMSKTAVFFLYFELQLCN